MKGQEFAWFIGKILDNNDTENLNRVKVLPYGYYNDTVTAEQLPWSTVMMPNTLASSEGIGGNHQLDIGSWVVGFFRDAPACQDAIVMGSIATSTNGNPDIPSGADVHNKIYTTKAGHTLHVNNEGGQEFIEIKHGKHPQTCSIRMTPNGNIEIQGGVVSINGSPQT